MDRNNDLRVFIFPILVGLIVLVIWAAFRQTPSLTLDAEPRVYKDHTDLLVRSGSSIPITVRGYYIRLNGFLDTKPTSLIPRDNLVVSIAGMKMQTWYRLDIKPFQVDADSPNFIPIWLKDSENAGRQLEVDIIIRYGDAESPSELRASGVRVNVIDGKKAGQRD